MKLSLFLFAVLATLAVAAPPRGVPKPAVPKPAAAKPAVPAPQAAGDLDAAVRARIEAFFNHLAGGKVEDAYARLFEGSSLAKEQPALLPTLINNTQLVLEKCGAAENGSVLRVRGAGKTLKEVTCILNCKKRPIRWTLYVYYGEGRWQVLDAEADLELGSFFATEKSAGER